MLGTSVPFFETECYAFLCRPPALYLQAFIFRRAAHVMQRATQTQIRRGSGGPKPQYEGAEKKFREIFVEDHQVRCTDEI